jgi:3-oxoacyl-[acyl-carrier protein] reductase
MTNALTELRTAIVTGGGQGLGRVYCEHLAAMGLEVIVADIDGERAEEVAQSIRERGGAAQGVVVDVADEASANRMARAAVDIFGSTDILVNNAAIFSTLSLKPFSAITASEWERVLAVNVNGPFFCAKAVAPNMRAAQWGRIVNVSSVVVHIGAPNYLHYVTSKSAMIGMTRSLARELGPDNITVNTLSPTGTVTEVPRQSISQAAVAGLTERQCLKRPAKPQDLADVLGFIVSDESSFMTGQEFIVDGGFVFA